MKCIATLAFVVFSLALPSLSNAEILNLVVDEDGSSGAYETTWGATNKDTCLYFLNVVGTQSAGQSDTAYKIEADPTDPTIVVTNTILNDSGEDWVGYRICVAMSKSFDLTDAFVTSPSSWAALVTDPVLQTIGVYSGLYVGYIDYSDALGSVVACNDTLQLGYSVSFSGYTNYSYSQSMSYSAVPEPSTFAMVLSGLLIGALVFRRK
jgi:hypothetical protein